MYQPTPCGWIDASTDSTCPSLLPTPSTERPSAFASVSKRGRSEAPCCKRTAYSTPVAVCGITLRVKAGVVNSS